MYFTEEQIQQIDDLCEKISASRSRSGSLKIIIRNNHPRELHVETPIFDEDHVLLGSSCIIYRIQLPESEIRKGRQRNRLQGKTGDAR